ncbi:hypothetical protein F5144DRAFT_550291 [Chaetomium tenue]|uniref:Uncharacterized protein n=1 Tax=Chaetomium tenue TaxID=1854479 RepID=A0ACB7NWI2_9PEZI|nr:hypothetical protein F5144DRAFT_550291 [Chaetomium globosum]
MELWYQVQDGVRQCLMQRLLEMAANAYNSTIRQLEWEPPWAPCSIRTLRTTYFCAACASHDPKKFKIQDSAPPKQPVTGEVAEPAAQRHTRWERSLAEDLEDTFFEVSIFVDQFVADEAARRQARKLSELGRYVATRMEQCTQKCNAVERRMAGTTDVIFQDFCDEIQRHVATEMARHMGKLSVEERHGAAGEHRYAIHEPRAEMGRHLTELRVDFD